MRKPTLQPRTGHRSELERCVSTNGNRTGSCPANRKSSVKEMDACIQRGTSLVLWSTSLLNTSERPAVAYSSTRFGIDFHIICVFVNSRVLGFISFAKAKGFGGCAGQLSACEARSLSRFSATLRWAFKLSCSRPILKLQMCEPLVRVVTLRGPSHGKQKIGDNR